LIRVIVRVKDKDKATDLDRYGTIIYKSPILNVVGLEINEMNLNKLKSDTNVISYEVEPEGTLMIV
jgi:hypothetical protein